MEPPTGKGVGTTHRQTPRPLEFLAAALRCRDRHYADRMTIQFE